MALNAGIVWEIRTSATASNANGGGFKTGASGTDFSQQDAAQYNLTSVTTAAADAILLHASAAADMVGNIAHITGGTNFTVGWYEIISVVAGVSITLDRNCTTAAGAAGVVNIGGAISLASTLDDDFFESHVAGNTTYVKAGTYTLGEAVNITAAGSTTYPMKIIGYQTTRGDNPTGSNRPTFACGANNFTTAAAWWLLNMIITSTGTFGLSFNGVNCAVINSKGLNTSTTVDRNGIILSQDAFAMNCEGQSYRGGAVAMSSRSAVIGCWLHDSNNGVLDGSGGNPVTITGNIISSNVTNAIIASSAKTAFSIISNNTLYGSENTTGTGLNIITGTDNVRFLNNIVYGFATGVSHADANTEGYDDYNCFNNNDSDVNNTANWQKGNHDVTTAPTFTSVGQVTGTAGAFVAGNGKLVDTSKDFTTLGVVAGRDFIYIVSGTGVTAGIYGISSISTTTNPNDTLNLDINPGTDVTANKVYQITIGHNFAVGTNMKAVGFPGAFQGGLTTGYMDIGAVQRQEPAGGSGGLLVNPGLSGGMNG